MSSKAGEINALYLKEMIDASDNSTLGRVRDLWWPSFQIDADNDPWTALDRLDTYMNDGRQGLRALANKHGENSSNGDPDVHRQRANQFLKSNTGKMFERFVGLALAHCLWLVDAPYAVLGFRNENLVYCHGLRRRDFEVRFTFGDGTLKTAIDADIFAFNPTDPEADIYMMSVKSTLKDRFHNVAFWNMLRRAAVSTDFPEISAENPLKLERMKYVAICSDLAAEQPDFGTEKGARNMLRIDASLLDGAYVTASKAKGLPNDCTNHLGEIRQHAFYRYSCFYEHLSSSFQ